MARRKGLSLTKRDVVSAALACLQKESSAGIGVNRVARELGVQPSALYNHVAGNDSLQCAVALEGWRRLVECFKQQVNEASNEQDVIRRLAYAFRHFVHQNPALHVVMANTKLNPDELEVAVVLQTMMALLSEALQPFGLTGDEAIYAMRMFRATLHGFVELERSGQYGSILPQSVEENYAWLVNGLINAFQQA